MKVLNPCHPGEILQDNLDSAGLSRKRISAHLGFEPQTLTGVLEGSVAMSIELAQALEKYGWSNADFGCDFKQSMMRLKHRDASARFHNVDL